MRELKRIPVGDANYVEMAGNHSETKPTYHIASGSLFHEVDTQTVYAFDEETETWIEQLTFGGGNT